MVDSKLDKVWDHVEMLDIYHSICPLMGIMNIRMKTQPVGTKPQGTKLTPSQAVGGQASGEKNKSEPLVDDGA